MPRSLGTSVENSFIAGFKTEHSGLNFPENACKDVNNCVFSEMGEVFPRDGVDLEDGHVWRSIPVSTRDAIRVFNWTGAGENNDTSLVVNQIGSKLYVFEDNQDTPVSASSTYIEFNLDSYKVAGSPTTAEYPVSFSPGNGRLYIAHRYMQPFYLEYVTSTKSLVYRSLDIKIRDFKVFDDGFANDFEPPTSGTNKEHTYNLLNQGWTTSEINSWSAQNGSTQPAKSMLMWYFRQPDAGNGRGTYNYNPGFRKRFPLVGASLAPRGKFTMNAFYQDRSAISGVAGLDIVSSGVDRPSVVAFMNSRVFYGGVKASGYGATIYFSSVIRNTDNELFFYQRSDPTSEISYELLPNDGGSIVIPEAENIVALKPVKNFLLVFCSNGVWSISGSEGVGFTATDYSVEKLSDTPILQANSIIVVDNTPIWWNNDGIYAIQMSTGNTNVASLTKDSIQTYFDSIPNICKSHVVPAYNRLTSEVYWLFSSDEANPKDLDTILVFRTVTKAFYKHNITQYGNLKVKGLIVLHNRASNTSYESVYDILGDLVLDNTGEIVSTSVQNSFTSIDAAFPLFLIHNSSTDTVTFGNFVEDQMEDWFSSGNYQPFSADFETGYRVRGDALRKFQVSYINVYSRFLSDSSCKVSGLWDYGINEMSNRITTEQEVCVDDSRFSVNSRKLRIRGSGVTLQLRFRSVGNKRFRLVGWSAQEVVNDRA